LEQRIEAKPGVRASVTGGVPPTGGGFSFGLKPEAEGVGPVDLEGVTLPFASVAPDYFETMGIPINAGRTFTAEDDAEAAILNEVMARRFWGDASPIGRRFRLNPNRPWQTVIGVAGDVKQMGPSDPMGEGMEFYQKIPRDGRNSFFALVMRSSEPGTLLQSARQAVWEIDARLPVVEAATMEERIADSIARPRFFLMLSSAFAMTGAVLAAIGVYGVAAYWVSRRRRELAVRLALGASTQSLMGLVLRRSVRLVIVGSAVGLALVVAGTGFIESMLFQTSGRDPLTLAAVTLILGGIAVLACVGPAFKAARVDPMTTLRAE
jgi:predicted permease